MNFRSKRSGSILPADLLGLCNPMTYFLIGFITVTRTVTFKTLRYTQSY